MRSEKEKEKTKMRERERRAITTNIFRGLRKHGNYPLTPRADINQVLRHLAAEAGWVVEPDGTTYRASTSTSILHIGSSCILCGATRTSANPTPTSSVVVNCRAGDGECSKPLSPQNPPSFLDSTVANANVNNSNQLPICFNYGGPSRLG